MTAHPALKSYKQVTVIDKAYFTTRDGGVITFSVHLMSVCLSVCNPLTFESLEPRKFIFGTHLQNI